MFSRSNSQRFYLLLKCAPVLASLIWFLPQALAQNRVEPARAAGDALLPFLLRQIEAAACVENVPPPVMLEEPEFTTGTQNQIAFRLPDVGTLPVPLDSIRNPFVITLVRNLATGELFNFPRTVDLAADTMVVETVNSLAGGVRYSYTSALYLPKCLVDCAAVTDSTQLELLCSPYADSTSSAQDTRAPTVISSGIAQLDSATVPGWWNAPLLQVDVSLEDEAGLWQALLFRRDCGVPDWAAAVEDTFFTGTLTATGYSFPAQQQIVFMQQLRDGCYEFLPEGKDASHTAESRAGSFVLSGNGGAPQPDAPSLLRIRIDTTPPPDVSLNCVQSGNSIALEWNQVADGGIGLAGYRILRDGRLLDTVDASRTAYEDRFSPRTGQRDFVYQVQPFDSLGNLARTGGFSTCTFTPISDIRMAPEPEFTSGHSNQVAWSGIVAAGPYSVFVAKDADYASALSAVTPDTLFTFDNLVDGGDYSYWVVASDLQGRTVLSDTVRSIQDATPPAIAGFEIPEMVVSNERNWVNARTIQLAFQARDAVPGKLARIQIIENGDLKFLLSLSNDAATLDTTLAYSLQTDACLPVEVALKVVDAAGNASGQAGLHFRLDDVAPPAPDGLQCEQLSSVSGIRLTWQESVEPDECSGLAGYRIMRDQNLVATVAPNVQTYDDLFSDDVVSATFSYEIQPIDSVGNVQTASATAQCGYIGASRLSIQPMPEFTGGLTNTVCWQLEGHLASLTVFLDASSDGAIDDSAAAANPAAPSGCHSFAGLVDGREYSYWLQGRDDQQRLVRSKTVSSIQDNTPPVIEQFTDAEAEILNDQLWTYTRNLRLRLFARDSSPGKIWSYTISENELDEENGTFKDSLTQIDVQIPYAIRSAQATAQRVDLSIRITDGAGNESAIRELRLFLQADSPPVFAFPNPFNPMESPVTIRVADPNEDEVNIYDFFGNHVRRVTGKTNGHDFVWDGRNGTGNYVANGGYICIGARTGKRFKIGVAKRR